MARVLSNFTAVVIKPIQGLDSLMLDIIAKAAADDHSLHISAHLKYPVGAELPPGPPPPPFEGAADA